MPTPIPPPLGQVAPGELYVDLQSRQLWLGVDASVSPERAVLISNIENADDLAAGTLAEANAYTDSQLATRAPAEHTHVATDVTDFDAAVDARLLASPSSVKFARGMIMMWSGFLTEIGVGPLAGWALCDGSSHTVPAIPPAVGMVTVVTPNLRDKFVVGAGNKLPGSGPAVAGLTIGGGSHVHTINPTALTLAEMPVHSHGGATGNEVNKHTHPIALATDSQGSHQHVGMTFAGSNNDYADPGSLVTTSNTMGNGPQSSPGSVTSFGGLHQHNVAGNTGVDGIDHTHTIPQDGSGQGHTHTIVGGGGVHEHLVTQAVLREAMPYMALAYIMKL